MLGQGGYGTVWEVITDTGESAALKFLRCGSDARAVDEIRAIRFVQQLSHPYLTPIKQVWCYRGYIVLTMPLADGSLLDLHEAALSEYGAPMTREELWPFFVQVAEALDFLNARRHMFDGVRVAIQHCDVKPSNILLFGDTAKLCDFGLVSVTTSHLKPHRRAGTLDYAAPEVFQGRLSDTADQYSLAVTYCELRGGRLPFTDTPAKFDRLYVRPLPDISMLPEDERPAIARALARVPQDRWPTCGEMMRQLEHRPPAEPSAAEADEPAEQ